MTAERKESNETAFDSSRERTVDSTSQRLRPDSAALTEALKRLKIEVSRADRDLIGQKRRNKLFARLQFSRHERRL